MARYNTISATSSVAGGATITTPSSGLLTTLTGPGTVTIPNPVLYAGQTQTYYNSGLSNVTLSTPSGVITGGGLNAAATIILGAYQIITLTSDGTNYIIQNWLSGSVITQSLTATGGTINAVAIGGTTPAAGSFNALTVTTGATSVVGLSASGTVSLTNNAAVTLGTAATGALQVTGGVGVAGGITVAGSSYFSSSVGIGANPASPLHVYQASGGTNTLTLATGFGSGNNYALNPFISGVSNGGFSIRDVTNSVDRIVIQYTTGNVGINTTSPSTLLHINGANYNTATTTGILIVDHGNNTTQGNLQSYLQFQGRYWSGDDNTANYAKIGLVHDQSNGNTGGGIGFYTQPIAGSLPTSPQLYLNGAGYLGVGTITPGSLLQVVGNSSNQGTGTSDNSYLATFDSYSSASSAIRVRQGGSNSYMSALIAGTVGAGVYSTHSQFAIGTSSNVNVNNANGNATTFTRWGLQTGPYLTYNGGSSNGLQNTNWTCGPMEQSRDGTGLYTFIRNGIYGTPSGNTTTIMEFTLNYGWNGGWFELELFCNGYYATSCYRKYIVGGGYTMSVTEVTNYGFGFAQGFASCNFTRTGGFANGTRSTSSTQTDASYYRYQIDLVLGAYVSAWVKLKTIPYTFQAEDTTSSGQIKFM